MGRLGGHSKAKYVTGKCLGTSRGFGWPNLLAERWTHSEGDLGEVLPRDTEVIVMLDGNLKVRRRGDGRLQQHEAVEGTVWICPAGIREDMIHLYGEIRESVHLFLPAQPVARAALEELDLDPDKVRLDYAGGFRDPVIETIARTVAAELQRPDPIGSLLVDSMSAALGIYLLRNYSNKSSNAMRTPATAGVLAGVRLARVLDYIDAHLDQDLALADLAREACLSQFHFARSFKAATGTPPHRYVLARRLRSARAMLEEGDLPLAQVASACGFCSQAHFSTSFKRATGLAPGDFRAARLR